MLVAVALMRRESSPSSAAERPDDAGKLPPAPYCAAGLEHVPGNGCFAQANRPAPRPLVVYLHGLHTDATMREELDRQARVARQATERGFDVLALRGAIGGCDRYPEMYCWPSNERTAERGPGVVASWEPALRAARERGAAGPRYLLGFSNGGYFAALVMTRALVPFEAITIAHGGPVEPVQARGAKPPALLLMADEDAALPEMMRLDVALSREKWPHASVAREGGHALTDSDVGNALGFFTRVTSEGIAAATARVAGHTPRMPAVERDAGAPQREEPGDASVVSRAAPSASAPATTDDPIHDMTEDVTP